MNSERNSASDSSALLELSNILNGSQDLDFILSNVLLSSMGKLMVSKACILLRKENDTFYGKSSKGIAARVIGSEFEIPTVPGSFTNAAELIDDAASSFVTFCRRSGIHAVVPMMLDEEAVGLICIGGRLSRTAFTDEDRTLLESIAAIAATATGNATMISALKNSNRQLDEKVQEQETLYEISREMNSTFEDSAIFRLLGYALMGQMRIMRFLLILKSDDDYRIVMHKIPDFHDEKASILEFLNIEDPIHLQNISNTESNAIRWARAMEIELIVPLISQNETRGLLFLGKRMGSSAYSDSDVAFLLSLAGRTIVALEHVRMFNETLERERFEQQLQVARTIQRELLPGELPTINGFEICAYSSPTHHVGGDYYDTIRISDTQTLIAIADVSGKGIPASLLMANIQAGLRMLVPLGIELSDATSKLNTLIYENTGADKFITFFWGIINSETHEFTYVNAGHNPPLLVHPDKTVEELGTGGIILGALPSSMPYELGKILLAPDDLLVLYTDGFSEAMSVEDQEFSEERVRSLLTDQPFNSADDCIAKIRTELSSFTQGAEQSDDITLIALRRK
jgi:phosphoserine phosphatase RsbU/P